MTKRIIFALSVIGVMVSTLCGCYQGSQEMPTGIDEGVNRTKITRFYQSNPMINQVQIRTPLSDTVGTELVDKSLVFQKNIGENDTSFELHLNGRNDERLNDVNKNRIVIHFDDDKDIEYSNNSSHGVSMVFDNGVKGVAGNIGTINGVLMGDMKRDKYLIESLSKRNIVSFSLEGFKTDVAVQEAEAFRKNMNTVLGMQ